jgi:hypothetical protein
MVVTCPESTHSISKTWSSVAIVLEQWTLIFDDTQDTYIKCNKYYVRDIVPHTNYLCLNWRYIQIMCVRACVRECVCARVRASVCAFMCGYVCDYARVCVHGCVRAWVREYVNVYVWSCVRLHLCETTFLHTTINIPDMHTYCTGLYIHVT